MSDRVLFDHDPATGMTEYFIHDPETGGFVIETVQDVENLIEVNKFIRNDSTGRFGDMALVASVPNVILMELAKKHLVTPGGRILDDKGYRRWLNDSENEAFRVKRCRV